MNIYDIKPHEPLWERVQDKHDPPEDWDKEDLINDIREKGFKYQLNVGPDGNIRNGNARYWVARKLFEEEGDERFRYLPVQRSFASGMHSHKFKAEIANDLIQPVPGETQEETNKRNQELGTKVVDQASLKIFKAFMNIKDLVIPSATEFEEYEIDEENEVFLKRHWEQTSGDYTSFVMNHPKEACYVFFLILEGHRSYGEMMEDSLLKDKVVEMRERYKNGREKWLERQITAKNKREASV
jgi:hypothetical protein